MPTPSSGIYCLLIRLSGKKKIKFAGKSVDFKSGYYVYTGSALGGFAGRLGRHLREEKKPHWHIDALLDAGAVKDIQLLPTAEKAAECRAAAVVRTWPGAEPVKGFGASDCRCASHLCHFARRPGHALTAETAIPALPAIFSYLNERYENHALYERDPFQTLVKCILSLRTQDPVTDAAADRLFQHLRTPQEFLKTDPQRIAELIYPVGMYRQKAGRLIEIAGQILEAHNGTVPEDVETLITLPGVGRKTANLVRSFAFHLPAVCVDAHVHRITNRWGLVRTKTPDETEDVLRHVLPQRYWIEINPLLVQHGQQICRPVRPKCEKCGIRKLCAFSELTEENRALKTIPGAPVHPSLKFRP